MWLTKIKYLIKLLPAITSLIGGNKAKREELERKVVELERRVALLERLA